MCVCLLSEADPKVSTPATPGLLLEELSVVFGGESVSFFSRCVCGHGLLTSALSCCVFRGEKRASLFALFLAEAEDQLLLFAFDVCTVTGTEAKVSPLYYVCHRRKRKLLLGVVFFVRG